MWKNFDEVERDFNEVMKTRNQPNFSEFYPIIWWLKAVVRILFMLRNNT